MSPPISDFARGDELQSLIRRKFARPLRRLFPRHAHSSNASDRNADTACPIEALSVRSTGLVPRGAVLKG